MAMSLTPEDFKSAANAALTASPGDLSLARELLSGAGDRPRYLVGRNDEALSLIGRFRIDGLVDDFAEPGSAWNGLPAIAAARLPADAVVVNCSTSISPVAVAQRLRDAGVHAVVPFYDLVDLVCYRLTADARFMDRYAVRVQDQYFEPFLELGSEVFVDAGGFDGDTTQEFCRRVPDYRQVHLFEPSHHNMQAARKRLEGLRDISFHTEALSDQVGVMRFNAEAGSASAAADDAGEEVQVTTLDLAVAEPVSFIKMDLEGWELKALAGCERHIRDDRPKLAIAVYHQAADFRTIARYACSIRPDYRLYLRHYTQGWSETVMFFV
jgi:FkbM family methyltransferase